MMRIRDIGPAVSFTWDGKRLQGQVGDTLASALLANGQRVVARSFKYHRPRGIFTVGSAEPNALVTIGSGAAQDPNIRATVQEIYPGLEARSQNRWPSLGFDILAINDLASPFLSAGFYYKTFMWPRSFWEKLYEPFIRRAAGIGALSGQHNADHYEKAFAFCDLLVIGSGPAGLAAALEGARAGARVILAEDDARMGGRLICDNALLNDAAAGDWVDAALAELAAAPNVTLMPRTAVTGAYDGGTFGAIERVGLHLPHQPELPRETFWRISARRAILATGAIERPIAFANNDRPGVMMASALRSYLHRYGVAAGQQVVIFTNNDDAYASARDLEGAGVQVTLVDARADAVAPAGFAGRFIAGAQVCDTRGRMGLRAVQLRHGDGRTEWTRADCLGLSGGWNPSLHLACHMNGKPQWDEGLSAFLPVPGMVPGLDYAGAANGQYDTAACLAAGQTRARAALGDLGLSLPAAADLPKTPQAAARPMLPLWQVPGKSRAWLDFQNDVTTKDVALAARENYTSVEHMKRYTTQGMAPDQGKNSNVNALAVLADVTGRSIAQTGITTYRPPFVPVSLAALGAGAQGAGFAPQRFTTSDAASRAMGAPMIEAGLWYRPSYFPQAGETHWRQSCDREVGYVRNAVGIADVSTLGKIDIQGPDAGAFLDFVYTNMFSTLPVGRVRYGLMLREDGHVMDDGTTARLGPDHYLMTTTTAAAAQVMKHLDFVRQAHCAQMQVAFTSVTEEWAQFAIAGPKARGLLQQLTGQALDGADWPFMACGPIALGDVQGRLFRISFSGEMGFELAVPARFGAALFDRLCDMARDLGGGPYGMEALNVLRIEKGFITHAEIHGRVTGFDIGMQGMLSRKKDFIGKAAASRPGLLEDGRELLVGLRATNGSLIAGARLFTQGSDAVRTADQGYITSVAYSPTLDASIGLGFLRNGRARMGEVIRVKDHLRGVDILAEVCNPVFFDPEGGRARD